MFCWSLLSVFSTGNLTVLCESVWLAQHRHIPLWIYLSGMRSWGIQTEHRRSNGMSRCYFFFVSLRLCVLTLFFCSMLTVSWKPWGEDSVWLAQLRHFPLWIYLSGMRSCGIQAEHRRWNRMSNNYFFFVSSRFFSSVNQKKESVCVSALFCIRVSKKLLKKGDFLKVFVDKDSVTM